MDSKVTKLDISQLLFGSSLFFTSLFAFHKAHPDTVYPDLHSFKAFDTTRFIILALGAGFLFLSSCIAFRRSVVRNNNSEPPTVRSYLPWIGCALPYFRNPGEFLNACSREYGSAFRFQIAGRWITAVSSPSAISSFLRDRSGVFEVVEFQMIHIVAGLRAAKDRLPYIYSVIDEKALVAAVRGLSQRNMSTLAPAVSLQIVEQLEAAMGGKDHVDETSLQSFVQQTLYCAVSKALLGPQFPTASFGEFLHFDDGVPYILQKLPYAVPRALRARENLVQDWAHFIAENWKVDEGGYLDGASDVMSDIVRTLKTSHLTNDETARLMNGFLWGTHTNVIRVCTWALCHLLTDKSIMVQARKEISGIVEGEFANDLNAVVQLDPFSLDSKFPIVTSLIKEVLRTKMLPVSARHAVRDTVLSADEGVILIRKGDIVLANLRGLHYDPELHESPDVFKADRFANDEEKRRSKTLSFFGGGKHMCAGRHHAMQSMRMFIILSLYLYDIELAPSSLMALPKVDPSGFTSLVRPANDLSVSIRRRAL